MLKRILISISVLFFLLISLPVAYLYQLDTDEIKQQLSTLLSASTHHKFVFNGYLHWQLLPTLNLVASDVTISPQKQGSNIKGKVGQLSFTLNTWDLLHRKINFKEIHLSEANLTAYLSPKKNEIGQSKSSHKVKKIKQNRLTLTFNQISVLNSIFTLGNAKNQFSLTNLNFKLKQQDEISQTVHFKSDMIFKQPNQKVIAQNIQFSGTVKHLDKIINNPSSLATLAIEATLQGKQIAFDKLSILNLSTKLSMNKGIIQLKPYQFELGEGKANGALLYDMNQDVLTIQQKLANIDTNNLIKALNSQNKYLSGRLNLNWKSKSHPVNQDILYHTQASGSLTYDNTLINLPETVKIVETMVQTVQNLSGKNPSSLEDHFKLSIFEQNYDKLHKQTNKGVLTAQFQLSNGVLSPINFKLSHPQVSAIGELSLNLKNKNTQGKMKLVTSSHDRNIQKAQTLLNGSFPFVIKGRMPDITAYPNMSVITPILINQAVKQASKEVIKKWGNRLLDKTFNKLND